MLAFHKSLSSSCGRKLSSSYLCIIHQTSLNANRSVATTRAGLKRRYNSMGLTVANPMVSLTCCQRPLSPSILLHRIGLTASSQYKYVPASAAFSSYSKTVIKKHEKGKQSGSHDNSSQTMIRLSKRMSELDICSRREADRYIMEGRVMIGNTMVEPILGQKVPANETDITLIHHHHKPNNNIQSTTTNKENSTIQRRPNEFSWTELKTAAVVLHKPMGYISGVFRDSNNTNNPTKQHVPAVRLLSPSNAYIDPSNYADSILDDDIITGEMKNKNNNNTMQDEYQEAKDIVEHHLPFQLHRASNHTTLQGYVPAGRLDLDTSGLLIFTHQGGVMAKKLISPNGLIEKEYLVVVEPLQNLHQRTITMDQKPPKPHRNLIRFRKGGHRLWGEEHKAPLRPVVKAEWLQYNQSDLAQRYISPEKDLYPNDRRRILRLVLKEGRKHQVRRMCLEILGMHVVKLVRTRIGPIDLASVPEGKWRPLRQHEAQMIFES